MIDTKWEAGMGFDFLMHDWRSLGIELHRIQRDGYVSKRLGFLETHAREIALLPFYSPIVTTTHLALCRVWMPCMITVVDVSLKSGCLL